MRYILFVGDGNKLAARVREWLMKREPPWITVSSKLTADELDKLNPPDLGISVGYRHIFKPDIINRFSQGIVNLHTGFLPYNRGAYPNVWPILDKTPAGVTLHYIDEGVDTGPIIGQREVEVEPYDTAQSLYRKLELAGFDLFCDHWPSIQDGQVDSIPQDLNKGTVHFKSELKDWDEAIVGLSTARFLDHLRARTFTGYPGVQIERDGKRYEVTVNMRPV